MLQQAVCVEHVSVLALAVLPGVRALRPGDRHLRLLLLSLHLVIDVVSTSSPAPDQFGLSRWGAASG